jgi:hypothetical protein
VKAAVRARRGRRRARPGAGHGARDLGPGPGLLRAQRRRRRRDRRSDIDTNEGDPVYSLAGQPMGMPLKPLHGFGVPAESYGFANKQLAWETIPPLLDRASPLRTAHLRDPVGPQILASVAKQSRTCRALRVEIASSPLAPRNSRSGSAI